MYFGTETYGLDGHIEHYGSGANLFRGDDFAQPRALRPGDVLSNGWELDNRHSDVYNGSVELHFTDGQSRVVAERLPLQLQSERRGMLPEQLAIGQILQTGDVVLDTARPVKEIDWHGDYREVAVRLTGGTHGPWVAMAVDLELAVTDETYPPDPTTMLGAHTLSRVLSMDPAAVEHLQQLSNL